MLPLQLSNQLLPPWANSSSIFQEQIDEFLQLLLREPTYFSKYRLHSLSCTFQEGERLMPEKFGHLLFCNNTKQALEWGQGIEHLWLLVRVWVNSFLLLEETLSLKFVGMQLDGEGLLDAEDLKEKGEVLKVVLLQMVRERVLLIQHGWPILVGAHPQLCILFAIFASELCNEAVLASTTPFIIHNRVDVQFEEPPLQFLHGDELQKYDKIDIIWKQLPQNLRRLLCFPSWRFS